MADTSTVPYGFYIGNVNGTKVANILPTYNTPAGFQQVDYNTFKDFTSRSGAFDSAGNKINGINSLADFRASGQAGSYLDGSQYESFKNNPAFKDFVSSYETGQNNPNAGSGFSMYKGAFVGNADLPKIQADEAAGNSSVVNGEVIPSANVKSQFPAPAPIDNNAPKAFDTGVGTLTVTPKTPFSTYAQNNAPVGENSAGVVNTPSSDNNAGLYARTGITPYTPSNTGQLISTPSVQDYFTITGRDGTFAGRAKEAAKVGMSNYTGSATQNIALLSATRNADLEAIVPGITKLPPQQQEPLVLQSLADHLKQQGGLQSSTSQNGAGTGAGANGAGAPNPDIPGYVGISSNIEDNLAALNKVNANIATLTQQLLKLQTQPYATQVKLQSEGALSPYVQGETARNAEINAVLQLPIAQQLQTAGINQANILKVMDLMKPVSLTYGSSLVNPFTGASVAGGLSTSDQALVTAALSDGRLTPDMLQKYSMPSIVAALRGNSNYNPVGTKAEVTANTKTLTDLTAARADTSRAITTAEANFPLLIDVLKKAGINDFNAPIGNRLEQALNANLIGSGDYAAFNALKTSLQTEYAQIISRGGSVTNQTRTEAENIVNGNISYNAMQELYKTLQKEAANVIAGYDSEIQKTKGQLGNQGTSGAVNLNDPKFAF